MKPIYIDFCFEEDTKIRRSIVVSFHEISKIIGQEITENELLPIYDTFLNSNDKIEKNLSIRYLPKILMHVSKEKKKRYFKYLEAASIFIDNIGSKVRNFNFTNWKNKLDVIEGILCYYNLYDNDIIYKSIFPQCITFCLDDIYKVRKTSSKVLATLIDYLYNVDYKKEQLFKIIESFALHKKFHQRINFVKMCKIFFKNKKLYEEIVKKLLNEIIEHEKIKDVKICLSKVLKRIIENDKEILYKDQNIHRICYKLKQENLTIINEIFNNVNIKYNNIEIEDKNKKTNHNSEKYFKGDDKFFLEEFKIELEKKQKVFFLDRSSKKLIVAKKRENNEPKKEDNNKATSTDTNTNANKANEEKKEDKQINNDANKTDQNTEKTESKNEIKENEKNSKNVEEKTNEGEENKNKDEDNKADSESKEKSEENGDKEKDKVDGEKKEGTNTKIQESEKEENKDK